MYNVVSFNEVNYYRKQTIHQEKKFDFLKDLVANVPDHQAEEDTDSNTSDTKRQKTPR